MLLQRYELNRLMMERRRQRRLAAIVEGFKPSGMMNDPYVFLYASNG